MPVSRKQWYDYSQHPLPEVILHSHSAVLFLQETPSLLLGFLSQGGWAYSLRGLVAVHMPELLY